MAVNESEPHRSAVIGNSENFWLYSSKTGFDLTRPDQHNKPTGSGRIKITTTTTPITVDAAKTALVIIDMQNFFLSPTFGRSPGAGHDAMAQLLDHAIPAARKAGIRIIWLNWGLSDDYLQHMPPAIHRAFGFATTLDPDPDSKDTENRIEVDRQSSNRVLENGKDARIYTGLGRPCGAVVDPSTGQTIDAGRLLMRDQWNTALYPPLDAAYDAGTRLATRPDVWIHKNRMSGMWGAKTDCEAFLEREGIRTLLFAGVNTDQCVGGTLTDSFSKGYDCVMLSDGCGTTSPGYAQQCFEFNAARTWGFVATCCALADGVNEMMER